MKNADDGRLRAAMAQQLALVAGSPGWQASPPPGMMRGVDFYNYSDLLNALTLSAQWFRRTHGYTPCLTSPTSFMEHIFCRKFLAPLAVPSIADKLLGREYVRKKVGDHVLTWVPWVGTLDELFTAELPTGKFFLKFSTGCGHNMLLNLPEDLALRKDSIVEAVQGWHRARYGLKWGEWQYWTTEPKLFLESFVDFGGDDGPENYRFFCFKGRARAIFVSVYPGVSYHEPSWAPIDVAYAGEPRAVLPAPDNLRDMIRVAEAISEELDFARIDLYSDTKSQVRFSEITFTPANANKRYSDFAFDRRMGRYFGE